MISRRTVAGIGLLLAVLLPAATRAADAARKLFLTSEAGDRDSVVGQAMDAWGSLIEEKSEGRIQVEVFYQGELGGQQELFDQLVKGNST